MITFARFNLVTDPFSFRHGFHVIFCRNVMIYFDSPTRKQLVAKFADHLVTGGFLMVGHSESLGRMEHALAYVEPAIYWKPTP